VAVVAVVAVAAVAAVVAVRIQAPPQLRPSMGSNELVDRVPTRNER
jgi:hypothetical protein